MSQQRRLTRAEKIAQAAAIKAGTISDPRHMIGLPPGHYVLEGVAAETLRQRDLLVVKAAPTAVEAADPKRLTTRWNSGRTKGR